MILRKPPYGEQSWIQKSVNLRALAEEAVDFGSSAESMSFIRAFFEPKEKTRNMVTEESWHFVTDEALDITGATTIATREITRTTVLALVRGET